MRHNFKPGDMAILKSSAYGHLVGCVVELITYEGNAAEFIRDGIRYQNPMQDRTWWVALVNGQTYTAALRGDTDEGPCGERRLIPLSGDFTPEQQKAKEAV